LRLSRIASNNFAVFFTSYFKRLAKCLYLLFVSILEELKRVARKLIDFLCIPKLLYGKEVIDLGEFLSIPIPYYGVKSAFLF
jgi:hypothetical protein